MSPCHSQSNVSSCVRGGETGKPKSSRKRLPLAQPSKAHALENRSKGIPSSRRSAPWRRQLFKKNSSECTRHRRGYDHLPDRSARRSNRNGLATANDSRCPRRHRRRARRVSSSDSDRLDRLEADPVVSASEGTTRALRSVAAARGCAPRRRKVDRGDRRIRIAQS